MFASPVLTNIKGFSYITVIVSHQWEKTNLVQSHAILNHMWLGQFYDILPYFAYLETSRGFTIQCLSSKTSATFTNMDFPFSVTIVFVDELLSGRKAISGKASNSSEVHVIQRVHAEARVTYLEITSRQIVLIVFPGRSTTLSCL